MSLKGAGKPIKGVDIVRLSFIFLMMMPASVFAGATIHLAGYPNAGVGFLIACVGFYVLHLVSDRPNPRLGSRRRPQTESITAINGMPLPADLIALIKAGRWKRPTDRSRLDRLFPSEPGVRLELVLYSFDSMQRENKHWVNQTDPMFLGAPDDDRSPGDIDPKLSVLVGDLGLGSDQPVALDYRVSRGEPQVLTLDYTKGRQTRWVEIAPNIRTFAELMEL
jgi:hypothetical protein